MTQMKRNTCHNISINITHRVKLISIIRAKSSDPDEYSQNCLIIRISLFTVTGFDFNES